MDDCLYCVNNDATQLLADKLDEIFDGDSFKDSGDRFSQEIENGLLRVQIYLADLEDMPNQKLTQKIRDLWHALTLHLVEAEGVTACLKLILDNRFINEQAIAFSIVLDDAPDWPIVPVVVDKAEVEDAEEVYEQGAYPWKIGDVRYEVSDGLANHRSTCFNVSGFASAVGEAKQAQQNHSEIALMPRKGRKKNEEHSIADPDRQTVGRLLKNHGLRPLVNALADEVEAAKDKDLPIKNEYGEPMDDGDIATAIENLRESLF